MQLTVVPGKGVRTLEPEPLPGPQETSAERRKRKEREREKGRVRSRAKVPGRSRGRPPNSSYAPAELHAAKDQRARRGREAADAERAECRARVAAGDAADDEYVATQQRFTYSASERVLHWI